jgi:hypothetical protein
MFRARVPDHYVPIDPDNVSKTDWLILLEVGSDAPHNIRVAHTTLEKTIAKKSNFFLRKEYFIVLEGYDPQTHVLYFCPQLYKRDTDGNLIALEGEEIGELLVQAFRNGSIKRQVCCQSPEKFDIQPIIGKRTSIDLNTLVGEETIPNGSLAPSLT